MRHIAIVWALTRFYLRITPRGWYQRPPFLPLPAAEYVNWRVRTAYGKHVPGWPILIQDLWQFGDWLRKFRG